ncbi:MAG: sigma 54-interacting transcriptional regulator [Candidatus Eisenbacteria sp.]|nr:sigma 54-interacting transcriptional regulator [Candidatus Eisenbacteria bacterium]
MKPKKTLLTFVGFHDPYSIGLVEGEEQPGPILSLLGERAFDRVILFDTPQTGSQTAATHEAIGARFPDLHVEVRDIPLEDPIDYLAILGNLRTHLRGLCSEDPQPDCTISVTSGTPQMHACWFLLAAAGEIPARIVNVRPPRYVTQERPLVTEVDVGRPEFPQVRAGAGWLAEDVMEGGPHGEPGSAVDELIDPVEAIRKLKIVGDHPRMRRALEIASALAPSGAPVLILGQTGTGKELIARLVHLLSGRPHERFLPVNCGAIPKELAESLLFGHKKGAFTGAHQDQVGKFIQADGGTLFLDDIGELPASTQAKLLRVLQDGQVEPIGAAQSQQVDVRVVAATNRDLGVAIPAGDFREDLYYRLAVGVIELPALRERPSDIPKLALHVLDRINGTLRYPKRLSVEALQRLQTHSWPGNVRALENVLERSARLCRKAVLDADDLLIDDPVSREDPLSGLPAPYEGFSLEDFLRQARKHLLLEALDQTDGNQSAAARLLGVSPQAVHKFLKTSEAEGAD